MNLIHLIKVQRTDENGNEINFGPGMLKLKKSVVYARIIFYIICS